MSLTLLGPVYVEKSFPRWKSHPPTRTTLGEPTSDKFCFETLRTSLRKHLFLLPLRRWGRFAPSNVCDSVTEIPYSRRRINICLINPVVMGFQMQISSILGFSWSILVKCCVHLRTSSCKIQMLVLEKTILHKY